METQSRHYCEGGQGSRFVRPMLEYRMSACGYQQTLAEPRCEVCLPLESRRRRPEFRRVGVLRPLTAQKQTSETSSLDVSF